MKIIGIVGSSKKQHESLSTGLGQWLGRQGVHLLTGGGPGVMAAVSKAFYSVPGRKGLVLGVLPAAKPDTPSSMPAALPHPKPHYPNPWIEVPIYTHLHGQRNADGTGGNEPQGPHSRNHINVLTCSLLIGLPGDQGTLAEMELAKAYGKPVVAYLPPDGAIGGKNADTLKNEGFPVLHTLSEVQEFVGRSL